MKLKNDFTRTEEDKNIYENLSGIIKILKRLSVRRFFISQNVYDRSPKQEEERAQDAPLSSVLVRTKGLEPLTSSM